ncbi:MAG: hypothetical protein KKF27_20625, partial [Gammaproteobacteria bacterium]|nr:hypothetical protein [Gammaproteobacteria bacterium]
MREMNNRAFFEAWSEWGDFPIEIEVAKLSIFRGIRNNLSNEEIQRVIAWEKPRTTAEYDEAGYCDLCSKIMFRFSNFDSSYSSAQHEMCVFTSEAILVLADQNKELQKQIKVDQIKKLQRDIEKLELELGF